MAILKGFPPSNTISPSVRITEKDLSFIEPEQSFHRAGIVGFASKGPINIPTVIRSRRELNTIFGFPHPEQGDPYLIYAAEQYLLVANELYIVRVADTDLVSHERAQVAKVNVLSAGGQCQMVSDTAGPYLFPKEGYFKWKLNGVEAAKTLVVLAQEDHEDPLVQTNGYSAAQLAEDLNLQIEREIDGIEFFYTEDNKIGVQTVFSFGPDAKLELMSVNHAIYGGSMEQLDVVSYTQAGDTSNGSTSVTSLVDTSMITIGMEVTGAGIPEGAEVVSVDSGTAVTISEAATATASGVQITFTTKSNVNVNPTGLGQGMTYAQMTGSNDRFPEDGEDANSYDFTGVTSDALTLQVVVDGTDVLSIDNVIQVVDLSDFAEDDAATMEEIVANINEQIEDGELPGGFEAVAVGNNLSFRTLHHGRDARLLVKPESTLFAFFGFDTPLADPADDESGEGDYVTAEGLSPVGVSGDGSTHVYGRVSGDENVNGDVAFTLTADTAGIDGNATQVIVRNNIREGNFVMEVYNNGVQVESWGNLTKDETSRFYVETFLSLVSDFVRVEDNTDNPAAPLNGTYNLSGGKDGIPADPDDQDGLLIGNYLGYTGMYALSESEQIDLDLVAVPGHSSTGVVMALIDLCQNMRMDCMAIIDPPFGLTVKEIVQWQNGAHPLNTTRFNSDFAALYWPWVKVRDTFNNVDVWIPPSGSVMAVYARNDALAAPWYAPAGLNRGVVPNITDVFSRPTMEERDLMYGNRNAINPIVQYADFQDFVVWGQKTLQRKPTALDRVNVRRLMFVIEKRIRQASRTLLFDPHDEIFREKFIDLATLILRQVQIGRGLTAFIIKADAELNTPDVIDRNEFRARIGVQPTRAVEFMFLEFSIHRTGSFAEGADTF